MKRNETIEANVSSRGLDPTGRSERLGPRWTFSDPPFFSRRLPDGRTQPCSTSSFQPGDFVQVLAKLDLMRFSDAAREERVEVGLAIQHVIRLYTKAELEVSTPMAYELD